MHTLLNFWSAENGLFWLDLSIFSYWTPWMLKSNIRVVGSLNILCYLLVRRFPVSKITRELKKNIFRLMKNGDKIIGGRLKLYINKKQKLVVIYLELIFTGIKTERWEAAEVRLSKLGLKQVGKIVCVGIKTSKKDDLCWVWSRENARAEI